ncbi:hypothetical protein GV793_09315 [Nocardia cyriacigeorgica]|nr:hypothetical protein [Nocardia cyriacigeorgica]
MVREPSPAGRPAFGRGAVLLACLAGPALLGALTRSFHWTSTVLVVLLGIAALVMALRALTSVDAPSAAGPRGGDVGGTPAGRMSDRPEMLSSGVMWREQGADSNAAGSGSAGGAADSVDGVGSRGGQAGPAALRRGVVVWSTLLVAILVWEGYAYVRQPDRSVSHYDYPTLSTLIDPVLEQGLLRLVGWLAWLAAGWWLVRR